MRLLLPLCLYLLASFAPFAATAQNKPPSPGTPDALGHDLGPIWQPRCLQSLQTPLPPEANVAPKPDTENSSAIQLYYGVGDHATNYTQARALAWAERAAVATHPGGYPILSGSLILAEIYANGLGTPRNPQLALRMACESTGYPNNLFPSDLNQLQSELTSTAPPHYDICDSAPKPVPGGSLCGSILLLRHDQKWSDEFKALSASWPPNQKTLSEDLKRTALLFIRSASIWETQPVSSLGANSEFQYRETGMNNGETLRTDNLLIQLRSFESGTSQPTPSLSQAQADKQLNAAYHHVLDQLRAPLDNSSHIIDALQERGIQRNWLAYRDAYLALITARYGSAKADLWRTQLTIDRTHDMQTLSSELEPVDPDAKTWLDACSIALKSPLPKDFPAPGTTVTNPVCSSAKPYYGLGQSIDYAAARTCAIQERQHIAKTSNPGIGYDQHDPASEVAQELNGPVILTMIYANGQGVPRNIPLARRFACEAIGNGQIGNPDNFNTDPVSRLYRQLMAEIDAIARAPHGKPIGGLDMCNYVSGIARLEDECGLISQLQAQQERRQTIATFAAKLDRQQRSAFLHLVDTLLAYLAAHDETETAVMGHFLFSGGWNGITPQREDAFLANLKAFEACKLPHATAAEYAAQDHDLDLALKKAIANASRFADPNQKPGRHNLGDAATPDTIRSTQRLWLVYRDAFATFGTLRYPKTTREAWLNFVTAERTKDLNNPCFFEDPCDDE